MDSLKNLTKQKKIRTQRDSKLHSINHVLADELATKLTDPSHFGFYLKMATTVPHPVLHRLAGEVLENPKVENKGRLFAYLIKKYNQEQRPE